MKKILSSGCSFLCQRGEVPAQCEIFCERNNFILENIAQPGRGNFYITRNLIYHLENFNYDAVIIGWSAPLRWDYETASGENWAFKMDNYIPEKFTKNIDSIRSGFYQWSTQVFLLTNYLSNKKIPFVMFNSLPCWYEGNSYFHEFIKNLKEFIHPISSQYEDVILRKEWYTTEDHHPGLPSQIRWSEFIENNLRINYHELFN